MEMKSLSQRDISIPRFTTSFLTIAKMWEQPKCLHSDAWIRKLQEMYIIEYCSATKPKILSFVTTWRDIKGITLNEISQRNKCHMISPCTWTLKPKT